jgi:hypothetical protein
MARQSTATKLYIFADEAEVIAASSIEEAKRIGAAAGSGHTAGELQPGWIVPLEPRAPGIIAEVDADAAPEPDPTKEHRGPWCRDCGGERVCFEYVRNHDRKEVDEARELREVVGYLGRLMVLETKGSDPDDDSAHLALIGQAIEDTGWKIHLREELEAEEQPEQGDDAQPEA